VRSGQETNVVVGWANTRTPKSIWIIDANVGLDSCMGKAERSNFSNPMHQPWGTS
jgi:hypothetical protein